MMNHSTPHDDALEPIESTEISSTNDAALEGRLHAYFAARADKAPAIDALWERLAPRLEKQAPAQQPAARAGSAPVAPVSQPVDEDADDEQPDTQPTPIHAPPKRLGRPQRPISRFARIASSVATLAAVLFVTLGAVALFRWQGGMNETPGSVVHSGALTWRKIALPPGVKLSVGISITYNNVLPEATNVALSSPTVVKEMRLPNTSLYVAPSDGNTAYICQTTNASQKSVQFWRTRDAGQHWTQLPTLSREFVIGCSLTIDQNNPLNVVATILPEFVQTSSTQTQSGHNLYALLPGAEHWQTIGDEPGDVLDGLVSAGNSYYALWAIIGRSQLAPLADKLFESTDQMRSWHEVDQGIAFQAPKTVTQGKTSYISEYDGVRSIWAQPTANGALLAYTNYGRLWISNDQGAHWSRITYPAIPPASKLKAPPGRQYTVEWAPVDALAWVQQPSANHPFRLCALVMNNENIALNVAPLYCSSDSGRHWTQRPQPNYLESHPGWQQLVLPNTMLGNGALVSWFIGAIYLLTGDTGSVQNGHLLGDIPGRYDPSSIPNGQLGVTRAGATFWQQYDGQTVYVSQYAVSSR